MKKIKNNQLGFGGIEILLAILILAVIGFGGYYVYHTQKSDNKTTSSSSAKTTQKPTQSKKAATSDPNTLAIPEWGVKLTFTNASEVTYKLQNQQDGSTAAAFFFKSSVTIIPDCQDLQSALIRDNTGPASDSVHYVNGYYYHIAGDPSPCSDPNGENGSINQERADTISALTTIGIKAN